jgi:hypothetical protein
VQTATYYVTATSVTAMNSRNRSTGNGPQEGRRNRPWRLSWERTRRHRSGDSAPISCPVTTTFLGANPVCIAERQIPRIVLYLVLRPVLTRKSLGTSRPRNTRWNTDKNCTRQKPFHGRARPHFARPYAGQIPCGASGVTPGHDVRASLARSVFCRVRGFKIVRRTLQRLFVEHFRRPERNFRASTETT